MRIETFSPVRVMAGTHKGSDLVYFERNNRTFARFRSIPFNPQTQDQVLMRAYFSNATKNWDTLTVAQRDAWQAYAELYFRFDEKNNPVTPSGIATYLKANSIRQVLGLPLISAAPVDAPPAPVTEVEQAPLQPANTLGITIGHSLTTLTGLSVIVRMTPAMPTVAREPRFSDYRFVRGVSPSSATPMISDDELYLFTPTKFLVTEGQRYGVEVRVVREADGLMSFPVYGDFIKDVS